MKVGVFGKRDATSKSTASVGFKKDKEPVSKPAPKPPEPWFQMGKQFTLPNGVNIIYTDYLEKLKKIKPPMYTLGIVKTGASQGASFTEYKFLLGGWKLMLSSDTTMDGVEKRAYDKGFKEGQSEATKKFNAKCRRCQDVDEDDWEEDDWEDEDDEEDEDEKFFRSIR